MPSNRKKPIALIKVEGRSHYSKEQIAQKEAQEVKVPFVDVTPPKSLPKSMHKEFLELADKLVTIGIMTELDEEALARYLQAKKMYDFYTKKLMSESRRQGAFPLLVERLKDISTMQDKAFRQVRSAAQDLGLTISSRCKLVMPGEKKKPENKFKKFDVM
jgi:P27 family predicted phage terminase small subunit